LTAARTAETIGAKPGEIDLERATWTVPAARMKAKRDHKVPLPPRAIEILKGKLRGGYIFPGRQPNQPLSNMAMAQLLRRLDLDVTVHVFRSTFKDWASDCNNYSNNVSEMAHAHTIGDKTEASYRRCDLFEKRRKLMLEWARYCASPTRSGKVTALRKSA
jgi:integrase